MIKNNIKFTKNHLIIGVVLLVIILVVIFSQKTSTNKTVVWEQSNTGLTTLSVNTIIADVNNQSILYAGTDTGIFKSIDKGTNWTAINTGLPNPLPAIRKIIHAPFSKAIFALGYGNLFESRDGGNNWTLVGINIDEIALKPNSTDAGFGEKIYILKDALTSTQTPTIYSISTGIGFFSEPQQETRTEINSFYEHLYKDQNEINKNNREEASKLLGKIIKNDDTSYDVVNVTKIGFLKQKEELPSGARYLGERITSLLSQNSYFTWLQTDRAVYFCWENFQNCEEDNNLQSILEKETKDLRPLGDAITSYSQIGVPHIYTNLGYASGKLLINTCLNRGGHWIFNNSLEELGFWPTHLFVYSHYDNIDSPGCYDEAEKEKYKIDERAILEDVIFAIAKDKKSSSNFLLVSKDNAKTWKVLKGNLPISVKSIFVAEIDSSYNIYLTTEDSGIFMTSIFLKDL